MLTISEHEERFFARMRKLRNHAGMSCEQLSKATGIHRVALSKMENQRRGVSLAQAIAIAGAFNMSLDSMVSPEPMVVKVEAIID